MAAAERKTDQILTGTVTESADPQNLAQDGKKPLVVDGDAVHADASASPARELQARLKAEVATTPSKVWRYALATVLTICLASFTAGFVLTAGL